MDRPAEPRLIVVMGVSGSGKTTVGEALAARLGASFADGDAFHSEANVAKMSRGEPLTDADRWPWLDAIGAHLGRAEGRAVVACSALRRAYRDRINLAAGAPVFFLHLDGAYDLIAARMAARRGHYMPPSLLRSQFDALEPIAPDETAAVVDISGPPDAVLAASLAALGAPRA